MKQYRIARGKKGTKYVIEVRTTKVVPNGWWKRLRGADPRRTVETITIQAEWIYPKATMNVGPGSLSSRGYSSGHPHSKRLEFTTIPQAQKRIDAMIANDAMDNSYEGDWQP
jgi:hypothetical protein